jgi:hypothetical protein
MIGDPSQITYLELSQLLDNDETFAREALEVLGRDYARPKSTYGPATSATALLEKWVRRGELQCHDERGQVVSDFDALLYRGDDDYQSALESVESGWLIDRASFVQLVERYGMRTPEAVGVKPRLNFTLLPDRFGYTVDGAARALRDQCGADEAKWDARILSAVRKGELRVRDRADGAYITPERVCAWIERIAIADLNAWLLTSGTEFQIADIPRNLVGDADGVPAAVDSPLLDSTTTSSWKLQVQAEAARRWRVLRKNSSPTKHALKDDLATWCRDNKVTTKTGISPNAAYIYRHALRQWSPPPDD